MIIYRIEKSVIFSLYISYEFLYYLIQFSRFNIYKKNHEQYFY